jgi:hypothetical protein
VTKQQAYVLVERKVNELQYAIMKLANIHVDGNVGLQEWCDHMDDVMYELSNEIYNVEE